MRQATPPKSFIGSCRDVEAERKILGFIIRKAIMPVFMVWISLVVFWQTEMLTKHTEASTE